jgi:ubiquinol-cytochrome c reductase iron-sulfur subunit
MASREIDRTRRRFLTQATTVIGGAGLLAGAVPFASSWSVSARAQAAGAPVEADLSKLEPGQKVSYEWRGKPVWVVRRTDRLLATLDEIEPKLADPRSGASDQPAYCENKYRAREGHREVLVMIPICTHLGCVPSYRPEPAAPDLGSDWLGGFFCPCHGSRYDVSGRVYKAQPAPTNMPIPPYEFVDENLLVIGTDDTSGPA